MLNGFRGSASSWSRAAKVKAAGLIQALTAAMMPVDDRSEIIMDKAALFTYST
jgi:hypothetical protein